MKTPHHPVTSLVFAASVIAVGLSTQSCAAAEHLSRAAEHSVNASGEALGASGEVASAAVKAASGIVAIPVYGSAAVLGGAGTLATASGEALSSAGNATVHGADSLWDFATGAPAQRPPLDREHALPPAKPNARVPAPDPAPGAVLNAQR
jgi:hypothetical protein